MLSSHTNQTYGEAQQESKVSEDEFPVSEGLVSTAGLLIWSQETERTVVEYQPWESRLKYLQCVAFYPHATVQVEIRRRVMSTPFLNLVKESDYALFISRR